MTSYLSSLGRCALIASIAVALLACQKGKGDSAEGNEETATTDSAKTPEGEGAGKKVTPPTAGAQDIPPPMDVSAPPADAKKTETGMSYVVITPGKGGDKPSRNDTALVNYTGWRTTGKMFFTSTRRGSPQPMPLPQVPPGWSENLSEMTVGEKRLVWMPPDKASRAARGGSGDTLVFEIELVEVQKAPPVPAEVAAPPADAKKLKSGVAYKVIKPGEGNNPRSWDNVKIDYTAWDTEGRMFDSTSIRKRPRAVALMREPEAMSEILQTMTPGQVNLVWFPAGSLHQRPGMPEGMQVHQIELISVREMPKPPDTPKDVAAPPKDA
ncbi:MAG: FKBP-type peptidyl-prolyl cis-trans isomerase, partial [Myxococcota bacterium]